MNLVHGPARHESFVAQWLEHLTGCSKGRSITVGNQILSLSHALGVLITSFLIFIIVIIEPENPVQNPSSPLHVARKRKQCKMHSLPSVVEARLSLVL